MEDRSRKSKVKKHNKVLKSFVEIGDGSWLHVYRDNSMENFLESEIFAVDRMSWVST